MAYIILVLCYIYYEKIFHGLERFNGNCTLYIRKTGLMYCSQRDIGISQNATTSNAICGRNSNEVVSASVLEINMTSSRRPYKILPRVYISHSANKK